jgi:putative transcriptional regulator
MPMDYSKLFSLMKAKRLTTYRIRKENIISQSTLQKLREGKSVTTETIATLCKVLNCQPGDIMEYHK